MTPWWTHSDWIYIPLFAQGLYDIIVAGNTIGNVGDLTKEFIEANFITLILRIGLYFSHFDRTDAILVAMAVVYAIIELIDNNQTPLQMTLYHGIGFLCGIISLSIAACEKKPNLTFTVTHNTLSRGNCHIDTLTGRRRRYPSYKDKPAPVLITFNNKTLHKVVRAIRKQKKNRFVQIIDKAKISMNLQF